MLKPRASHMAFFNAVASEARVEQESGSGYLQLGGIGISAVENGCHG
jgi:hypothetical protein